MNIKVVISSVILAAAMVLRAEIPPDWNTNYDHTVAAADLAQRPALLFFTASWCGPCKMMVRQTLSDVTVTQQLARIDHVAIDIDERPDVANKHGVHAVPTFILLSGRGDEVKRTTGFEPPADFLSWVSNGLASVEASAAQQAQIQAELTQIDALLNQDGPEPARNAAAQLFDLCTLRDSRAVRAAVSRLNKLAARTPAALLDGLNHPQLAARLRVAVILTATIGDSFDVDPWSDAATRKKAVESWRTKLTVPAH